MNGIAHISELEGEDTVVLVHDAVRPLLPEETISSNIAVCLSRGNAITAIESQESFMVMEQKEKDSLIQKQCRRLEAFSWEKSAKQLVEIYKTVV